jgi:transcription elongation factor Elf1
MGSDVDYLFIRRNKMKIKQINSQNRRDFRADYECEHCGFVKNAIGYDDINFHQNVIPKMECEQCGKTASDNYRPLATKYPEEQVV